VVIGPGLIGCGFAGQLLRESGWDVCFVGRGPIVDVLRRHRRYLVRLVQGGEAEEVVVEGVSAVPFADGAAAAGAIAGADLVVTAVGPANLAAVAPTIATAVAARRSPLDVLAFENLAGAGAHLRRHVALHLPRGFPLGEFGFAGAVVQRAVSRRLLPSGAGDWLRFVGEREPTFVVERPALVGPLPKVIGLCPTDRYGAHVARKLYTYSAGHAACAYLGYLQGYHYVHTAVRDPEIRAAVREAMAEGQRGLAARYGPAIAGGPADLDAVLERFGNAGLADPIARVGRDPRRKLSAGDRLVGAATLAAAAGVPPQKLAQVVAAALVFCDPAEPGCRDLYRQVAEVGVAGVLAGLAGLGPGDPLVSLVAEHFDRLRRGWSRDNLLLSLERQQWAWASGSGRRPALSGAVV
jgi:mannitol-1-phosphate 5-dehydrogenase